MADEWKVAGQECRCGHPIVDHFHSGDCTHWGCNCSAPRADVPEREPDEADYGPEELERRGF